MSNIREDYVTAGADLAEKLASVIKTATDRTAALALMIDLERIVAEACRSFLIDGASESDIEGYRRSFGEAFTPALVSHCPTA